MKSFILFKLRFLLIILLAVKWTFFYKKWLSINHRKKFTILNYENLQDDTVNIVKSILNKDFKYKIKNSDIEKSVNLLKKSKMQKNATKNKLEPITVSSKFRVKINNTVIVIANDEFVKEMS